MNRDATVENIFCCMPYIIKIILASMLMLLMAFQATGNTHSDSINVYFRAGYRIFEPSLRNNRAVMDSFVNVIKKAHKEDNIERIVVSGYASPDGTSTVNDRLATLRCHAIADYLSQHTGVTRESIRTVPGGVAWDELRRLVEANPEVPSREKVLDILNNTPIWIFDRQNKIIGGRKAQLMSLDRGDTYRWMLKHLFPELRNAIALAVFFKGVKPETEEHSVVETVIQTETAIQTDATDNATNEDANELLIKHADNCETGSSNDTTGADETDYASVFPLVSTTHRPFYMTVKTNMLYDAALVPNLGAEFYIGKNISVYGEWMYAWWDNDSRHHYWRIYGGDIGMRWWFGRKAHAKPLTGHHLGIYAGMLTFDFEIGDTGYMGGKPGGTLWDRWLLNAGLEYGYSLSVAKRLNIDFSIGFGYVGGNYIKYFPFDNEYYSDKEYKVSFFGPTKAEISLVWLLGRGNTNGKKGGDR